MKKQLLIVMLLVVSITATANTIILYQVTGIDQQLTIRDVPRILIYANGEFIGDLGLWYRQIPAFYEVSNIWAIYIKVSNTQERRYIIYWYDWSIPFILYKGVDITKPG